MVRNTFCVILIAASFIFASSSPAYSTENSHPRFMREFAEWAEGKLQKEKDIKSLIRSEMGEDATRENWNKLSDRISSYDFDFDIMKTNYKVFEKCLSPKEFYSIKNTLNLFQEWLYGIARTEIGDKTWLGGDMVHESPEKAEASARKKIQDIISKYEINNADSENKELSFYAVISADSYKSIISEKITSHPRFMKEYAHFVQDKLEKEQEIRDSMRSVLMKHKEELSAGMRMDLSLLMELYKPVFGDYLCMEDDAYEKKKIANDYLDKNERNEYDEVSETLSYWTMALYMEETAKLQFGEDEYQKAVARNKEKKSKANQISASSASEAIIPLIRPYLLMQLSEEDRDGMSYSIMKCSD